MKIDTYVDAIIKKFDLSKGYSEFSEQRMREVVRDFLLDEHDKELNALSTKMELDRIGGKELDLDYYHDQYDKVRDRVIERAEELGWMGEGKKKLLQVHKIKDY